MKIVYTKHAQERIKKRGLSFLGVTQTLEKPDRSLDLSNGEHKFIKQQGKRLYHVVAKYLPDQHSWLIISAWVRGEEDKASLLWRLIVWPFKMIWRLLKLLFGWY